MVSSYIDYSQWLYQKKTSPGTCAISNVLFLSVSSHDGMTSGMYHKPDIPKQVTFEEPALSTDFQKTNKSLNI